MVLLHEPVEIIHEPVSGILRVLEMNPYVNGLHRTHFLAHSAEDAPEFIDLINNGIAVPLVVLSPHQTNAIGGTNGGAQTAGYTLRPAIGVDLHAMRSPPTRGKVRPLLRVLEGDLVGVHKMLEGQSHSLEGGT